jgi:hypothetical protein
LGSMQGLWDAGSDEGTERRDALGWQQGVMLRLGWWLTTEARRLGLGSTGSAVKDWLRQLKGRRSVASRRRGGEQWLVGYVARRRNDHPAAYGAPRGVTPEPRQRQRNGGCCLAGVGVWPRHRRLERKRRRGSGRPRPLLKRSWRGGSAVGVLAWGRSTRQRGWGGVPT